MYLDNYKHLLFKNVKINCSKNHLFEKVIFGQKDMYSISKVIFLVHLILFASIVELLLHYHHV
jgi:hypothetical protein